MPDERQQQSGAASRAMRLVLLLMGLLGGMPVIAKAEFHLVVGVYENPPKVYRDQAQRPAGLFIELLEAIAAENGWALEYRDCQWSDCLKALEAGELDLMPDVAATEERRRLFAFHQVPVTQGWSQVYRPTHLDLLTLDDLAGLRVTVLQGSVQEAWFRARPELAVAVVPLPSKLDAFVAVEQGLADAVATNNFFGSRFGAAHGLAEAAITFDQQSLHFAAPLSIDPQILWAIDGALREWKTQRDSPYFVALQRALVTPPRVTVPSWVIPLTSVLLALTLLLAGFSVLLRWRVQVRTEALAASRGQLEHVLASSPVTLYRASGDSLQPVWVSPTVERVFGLNVEALVAGPGWQQSILEEDRSKRAFAVEELARAGQLAIEYRIHDGEGKIRHVRDEMRCLPGSATTADVIGTWTDLTAEHEQQERIRFLSDHDRLTCLPNRNYLYQQLNAAIEHSEVSGSGGMILIIDLDRFGLINETVGTAVGDQLLVAQARRLLAQVAATDLVARSGNDEFCLLLGPLDGDDLTSRFCNKLLQAIAQPILIEEHQLVITASIGLARFPEHGRTASEVMAAAELALQRARKGSGNAWEIYQPEFGAVTGERLYLEQGINRALEQDEFVLAYQPQYELKHQRLVGLECLIRWQHPQRGLLSPAAFIPFAEETGQIHKIDLWVLDRACRQIAEWQGAGLDVPRLSVNLSASEFRSVELAETVAGVIRKHGISADRLELEITETTLMQAPDQAAVVLRQLHQLGVRLSMDDFGTGYSNLAQLLALPLDQLKIDSSLLVNIEQSGPKRSVMRAIIALGKALDMELIAEGIETSAQLEFLKREDCPLGQGYLLGRPMPAEQAMALLPAHVQV